MFGWRKVRGPASQHTEQQRPSGWRRSLRIAGFFLPLLAGLTAGALFMYELETSALQARLFARYASRVSHHLAAGASDHIAFPTGGGPFDERRGYARIPEMVARLGEQGFAISEQSRMSPELTRLIDWGIAPPDREVNVTGLVVRSADGTPLHDARRRDRVFVDYHEVPPLITEALLFIENKELLAVDDPRSNPTVEWDRMAKASLLYVGSKLGLPVAVEGGSTLATQLEKFRHSPSGRTSSPQEKLRQITSASLKAYRDGIDTRERRREIIVAYLNSVPLAAAPGFGEVNGIGDGLWAWFGLPLEEVVRDLHDDASLAARARAFKHTLALLAALPAPSAYLSRHRDALQQRMASYLSLMQEQGVIGADLADAVRGTPLVFLEHAPATSMRSFVDRKAATAVRTHLLELLGIPSFYELDQLHLETDSTIDLPLQQRVIELFHNLESEKFIAAKGLNARYLLERADPTKVLYSLLLFERTADGNLLRVQTDSLDQPFDLNRSGKVELGSTAKLRTLAHYLEIIASLHAELAPLDTATLRIRAHAARDPLTEWVADELSASSDLDLPRLIDRALDRTYSVSAGEAFFTGGGLRTFSNSTRSYWARPTLRQALARSINLPFVRLMRDLVQYHRARLPYDADLILDEPTAPERVRMLEEITERESLATLARAHRRFKDLRGAELINKLIGKELRPEKRLRKLAILYYAWHRNGDLPGLQRWLNDYFGPTSEQEARRMQRAYGNPSLNLADYGYLAGRRPLDLWYAGETLREPGLTWPDIVERSVAARRVSSSWLFKKRNRRAQERRLRIRIERDAFARMTPYWQRLGFPFSSLVPSYATALGGSGDRPTALATLLGIIVNDGLLMPSLTLQELRFAPGTPYETALRPVAKGERVMDASIARALRTALTAVVSEGTASSLAGAFVRADGSAALVGGKTGTGDNRRNSYDRWGQLRASHAINRTAAFLFFIEDRYFGVLTALVPGKDAERYHYTSRLPVRVLRLLAPAINSRLQAAAEIATNATGNPRRAAN